MFILFLNLQKKLMKIAPIYFYVRLKIEVYLGTHLNSFTDDRIVSFISCLTLLFVSATRIIFPCDVN